MYFMASKIKFYKTQVQSYFVLITAFGNFSSLYIRGTSLNTDLVPPSYKRKHLDLMGVKLENRIVPRKQYHVSCYNTLS